MRSLVIYLLVYHITRTSVLRLYTLFSPHVVVGVSAVSYYIDHVMTRPECFNSLAPDRCGTNFPWWRHQKETFFVLLGNSPVTGDFPAQRPVTRSFDVFFDLRLNKRLSKQWWGWWFDTPSRPPWRHCNKRVISEHMVGIQFMTTSCEIALECMTENVFNDQLTLVQVMA